MEVPPIVKMRGLTPILQLHLLVALLATTAVVGRLLSLPAPVLVAWRTLLAAGGVAVWCGLVRRRPLWPGARQVLALLGVGTIIGVHWLCFFGAIRLANISICLTGMATISFFTAFTEPWLEKRSIRLLEVLLGGLVLIGIGMVAGFERGRLAGLLVALLGALLAAIFPVLNRRLVQTRLDPQVMVGWEMIGACLASLAPMPWLVAGGYPALFAWRGLDWLWLLYLAWVCTVFAHGFHIHLLRHLSAYTANLAMNLEPIYGILGAVLVFGEHRELHPGFFLGLLTILAANILHALLPKASGSVPAF